MNQRLVIRAASLLLAVSLVGCDDTVDPYSPESTLVVNRVAVGVDPGDSFQLTATEGGSPASVTFESSNPAVATVSSTGLVTGVASGTAAVIVTSTTNPSERRTVSITVFTLQGTALTSGVPLTDLSNSAPRGATQIYRIFVPDGATNLRVQTSGGTGDVDIYVRQSSPTGTLRCFGFNAGNGELCNVANPARGTWYIILETWDPWAGVTLVATVTP
jgi:hypothetical protein